MYILKCIVHRYIIYIYIYVIYIYACVCIYIYIYIYIYTSKKSTYNNTKAFVHILVNLFSGACT